MVVTTERSTLLYFENSLNEYNNYIDIQQKNMQVRFIMILRAQVYNSLSHPTLNYEVQKCLNTNWLNQLIQVKLFISVLLLNHFGNSLMPYFPVSNVCHKSCRVSSCLLIHILNFIFWTHQLPGLIDLVITFRDFSNY